MGQFIQGIWPIDGYTGVTPDFTSENNIAFDDIRDFHPTGPRVANRVVRRADLDGHGILKMAKQSDPVPATLIRSVVDYNDGLAIAAALTALIETAATTRGVAVVQSSIPYHPYDIVDMGRIELPRRLLTSVGTLTEFAQWRWVYRIVLQPRTDAPTE